MVRKIYTFSVLLVAYFSVVSALPAPARPISSCALSQQHGSVNNGISLCSLAVDSGSSPTIHTLERRVGQKIPAKKTNTKTPEKKREQHKKAIVRKKAAGIKVPTSRKGRAKARVAKGLPKATAKDKGHVPGTPKKKSTSPMSAKKQAIVSERKENRVLAKKQKHAEVVATAKQKHKAPPYGVDENGKLTKVTPDTKDLNPKVKAKMLQAKTDKATRKAAWDNMSPADKAKKEAASKTAQAVKGSLDKTNSVKEKNRQNRIITKAKLNAQRKATGRKDAATAKAAYNKAHGLPTDRKEQYQTPRGKNYNGKDVRQGVYSMEHASAQGGVGFNSFTGKNSANKDKLPKKFENRLNSDGTTRPLSTSHQGDMLEYPILHDKQKGHDGRKPAPTEARVITGKNSNDETVLLGKVAHGTGTGQAANDHFAF